MEDLESYKVKVEQLNIKVKELEKEKKDILSKMLYFREFKNLSYKTNRFMSFLRKNRSEIVSEQAERLWNKYWKIIKEKEKFFDEPEKKP